MSTIPIVLLQQQQLFAYICNLQRSAQHVQRN